LGNSYTGSPQVKTLQTSLGGTILTHAVLSISCPSLDKHSISVECKQNCEVTVSDRNSRASWSNWL